MQLHSTESGVIKIKRALFGSFLPIVCTRQELRDGFGVNEIIVVSALDGGMYMPWDLFWRGRSSEMEKGSKLSLLFSKFYG